ncbi:putative MFS family arabinose efflux permease [Hydrogenispora ethanolica]|uniref:Putative MFS family arabinose efflux permease n=1 Tax=Hydrogenispora ethanolica TaxID=1082276 RepID=A0A4V2QAV8_HYDET|nr:MFS transporter [Hydrogenispora ethanolica]TCL54032.1 putative MFS family arabinose efflux permease [Hydrogenispora ethanolica]
MSSLRKEIILLLAAVFLLVLGACIVGTILTPYAESLGAGGVVIGAMAGSLYIVRLFVGTPIGRLADRRGTLAVLRYSLMLYPLVAVAYWLAGNVPVLIAARLLHGLASAMMLPMAMAYMGEVSPAGREGYYMGLYNTVTMVAGGVGPQAATIIAARYGNRATFFTLFVFALLSLVIFLLLRRREERRDTSRQSAAVREPLCTRELLRNRGLLAVCSVNMAFAVISCLMGFFFILYPPTRGISLVLTGTIIAVYNVTSGLAQIPLGRFADRYDKFRQILGAGIATAAILVFFPFVSHGWAMMLLMAVLAVCSAVLLSASSACATILGRSAGMGSTMGFLGTANSVGMALGSLVLSLMPQRFGIESLFYLAAGITLGCTLLFAALWKLQDPARRGELENRAVAPEG